MHFNDLPTIQEVELSRRFNDIGSHVAVVAPDGAMIALTGPADAPDGRESLFVASLIRQSPKMLCSIEKLLAWVQLTNGGGLPDSLVQELAESVSPLSDDGRISDGRVFFFERLLSNSFHRTAPRVLPASAGNVSAQTIQRYIDEQKGR